MKFERIEKYGVKNVYKGIDENEDEYYYHNGYLIEVVRHIKKPDA